MAGRRAFKRGLMKTGFPLIRRWRAWNGPSWQSGGVPCGIFREKRELARGRVEGRMVADGQLLPPLPENSEMVGCGLGQTTHANWAALWTRRERVHLLGRSLVHVDPTGRAAYEALYGPQAAGDPVWRMRPEQTPEELPGKWTSLVSRWDNGTNYYHWITDALTRLVHLQEFPEDVGIILRPGIARFAEDSLKRLGLWERVRLVEGEHLLVENYWFAGPLALSGCPDPLGTEWLRKSFGAAGRKIFVSRQGSTREVVNLRELEHAFHEAGWEVIDPGRLSFGEQMETFKQARVVAGVHGAGMTNVIWAPQGTRVVELMPKTFRNGCYEGISLAAGHDHRVLLCPADRSGNMSVPADIFRQVLEAGD